MIIYLEGRLSQHDVRRTLSSYASNCHMVLAFYLLSRSPRHAGPSAPSRFPCLPSVRVASKDACQRLPCIFKNLPGYSGERRRGEDATHAHGDTEKWYGSGRDSGHVCRSKRARQRARWMFTAGTLSRGAWGVGRRAGRRRRHEPWRAWQTRRGGTAWHAKIVICGKRWCRNWCR